jgi:SAM-dependent methyltransferase
MGTPYTGAFFDELAGGAIRSARAIVPLVVDLVEPRSAIDVGCGTGAWLAVLVEHGIEDVVGVDGAYVDRAQLLIPPEKFVARDLSKPLAFDRRFDLALSLEVAEHLPAASAPTFVKALVELAPVVLFSAAIPGQGGLHHINERWPDYWASLFGEHGFEPVDAVRPRIWTNPRVEPWYAQNLLLFVSQDALTESRRLKAEADRNDRILALVHPRIFALYRPDSSPPAARDLVRQLRRAVWRTIRLAGMRWRRNQSSPP